MDHLLEKSPRRDRGNGFVVPTARFTLLYVWFVLDHGRRRVLHFNVTRYPSAIWVIQQLRETFPDHPAHRYLVLDNDALFSAEVARAVGWHSHNHEHHDPLRNAASDFFTGSMPDRVAEA
ncbi:MAG: hypothetical protein ACREA0_34950 [bacterium]